MWALEPRIDVRLARWNYRSTQLAVTNRSVSPSSRKEPQNPPENASKDQLISGPRIAPFHKHSDAAHFATPPNTCISSHSFHFNLRPTYTATKLDKSGSRFESRDLHKF